jgi:peptidoglycan/xylan/chitin deacetylase (PgdA/CDA1 family)
MKKKLADLFFYTGISYLLFRLRLLTTGIRVINYHCTPEVSMPLFEEHLRFYKKYFRDINLKDLSEFFTSSSNSKQKTPGLIITFDDGLRSNFDYAVSALEKYGFTGWFFIPAGFLLDPTLTFVLNNSILVKQKYSDDRYGMSLSEAKHISLTHVIGCHTFTHHRVSVNDSQATLDYEIKQSKYKLEVLLEKEILCFCWVGGELHTYTAEAYEMIKEAQYKYSFTTNNLPINRFSDLYAINRTNIEAEYSIQLLMFQLSGIMDMLYFKKRKQVKNIFSHAAN